MNFLPIVFEVLSLSVHLGFKLNCLFTFDAPKYIQVSAEMINYLNCDIPIFCLISAIIAFYLSIYFNWLVNLQMENYFKQDGVQQVK